MNFKLFLEQRKVVKQFVEAGKLDQEIANKIINLDPHPKKAFSGWIAKQYIDGYVENLLDLQNTLNEWYALAQRNQTRTKDIYQYRNINEIQEEVDKLNAQGANVSKKQIKGDFDVIMDNESFYIVVPYSHAASRKLGLAEFACRDNPTTGKKDSVWCTTYANDTNWNSYFYKKNITFYYIKVKDPNIVQELNKTLGNSFVNVALAVYPDSTPSDPKMFITESKFSREYSQDTPKFQKFMQITGLNKL